METKLKVSEILNLHLTLKTIIDHETNVDALFKFKLLGILKAIEHHVIHFEMVKNEKIKALGTEDENGNTVIPADDTEAIQKFSESMEATLNSEVTVAVDKLKVSEIFDKGVPCEYLIGLYSMMEE